MTSNNGSAKIKRIQAKILRMRIARRSITYLVKTLVAIVLVAMLCLLSFIMCMRLSNAYILVNEGMSLRAECILLDGEILDLTTYFTEDCILNDSALSVTTYQGYTISDYDYRLDISNIAVWPWNSTITLDVIEECRSIAGTPNVDTASPSIPSWTPMKYEITLSQIDSRWYISSLRVLEIDPDIPTVNTPDPNLTPMPAVTATPIASSTPVAEATP
ncbi:MAG: hypothetical protein PHT58_00005 [Eubacteriales bacterium]|nr:hypothetical protein [Eubacteriales bacterium]